MSRVQFDICFNRKINEFCEIMQPQKNIDTDIVSSHNNMKTKNKLKYRKLEKNKINDKSNNGKIESNKEMKWQVLQTFISMYVSMHIYMYLYNVAQVLAIFSDRNQTLSCTHTHICRRMQAYEGVRQLLKSTQYCSTFAYTAVSANTRWVCVLMCVWQISWHTYVCMQCFNEFTLKMLPFFTNKDAG